MPAPRPYSLDAIVRRVGLGRQWVVSRIGEFQPDEKGNYSPDCEAHLMRERTKFLRVAALGNNYTLPGAAAELACSRAYLVVLIDRFNLPGVRQYRNYQNRIVNGVPRTTIAQLKRLTPLAPESMATVAELRRETGWASGTIVSRLGRAGIKAEPYRAIANGHVTDHYPRETAIATLGMRPCYAPPGGTYLTATSMSRMLNRTYGWVATRLRRPHIGLVATARLDDSGTIRDHYPRWVYLQLEHESELLRQGEAS